MTQITAEQLRELLHYDPVTGVFRWLRFTHDKAMRIQVLAKAGHVHKSNGYFTIKIERRAYAAHRLAWLYVHGVWPKVVDHKNGDRLDNRISNLRDVSPLINSQNQRLVRSSRSGLLGASWSSRDKAWRAHIRHSGRQMYLGSFSSPEEAHASYLAAKRLYHEGYQP